MLLWCDVSGKYLLLLVFSGKILGFPFSGALLLVCCSFSGCMHQLLNIAENDDFRKSPKFSQLQTLSFKAEADNEVWNWIKFQFLVPFSFVGSQHSGAVQSFQCKPDQENLIQMLWFHRFFRPPQLAMTWDEARCFPVIPVFFYESLPIRIYLKYHCIYMEGNSNIIIPTENYGTHIYQYISNKFPNHLDRARPTDIWRMPVRMCTFCWFSQSVTFMWVFPKVYISFGFSPKFKFYVGFLKVYI